MSCLSNPRWLRVGVGAATVQLDASALKAFLDGDGADLPEDAVTVRADDAGRTDVADQLRFTPRIYRWQLGWQLGRQLGRDARLAPRPPSAS